jgi:hypothetical protein
MPFATGNRTEVLVVLSNNGGSETRPASLIGEPRLYKLGQTPRLWTRFVRPAARAVQRNLYTTGRLLPVVIAGVILLAVAGRASALVLLFVAPVYYLVVQSAFHTEYRYILPIHYFLFVAAAVTLYCAWALAGRALRGVISRLKPRRGGL